MSEPGGSRWTDTDAPKGAAYDARWTAMAASGQSIHGEADFVSRLRPDTVLDAGCGTGRVAIELAHRGVTVVGADLDPTMLAEARRKAPALEWVHGDLATVALERYFDVVVMAGNVMIFVARGTEAAVVASVAARLAPGGLLIAGFQLKGRLPLTVYDAAAAAAGLAPVARYATWDRDPFVEGGDYVVAVDSKR